MKPVNPGKRNVGARHALDTLTAIRAFADAAGAAAPSVTRIARRREPYRVLVSTVISLRTKDAVTEAASNRLFDLAGDVAALATLPVRRIERAIYPAGFFRTKAGTLKDIARALIRDHGGEVPRDVDTLLTLKGVGRKTANLVASLAYGVPAICVDVHVHRIANRLEWVDTRRPEETERELSVLFPRSRWIELNAVLVGFGQRTCGPVSPRCSSCPVRDRCPRAGVTRSR